MARDSTTLWAVGLCATLLAGCSGADGSGAGSGGAAGFGALGGAAGSAGAGGTSGDGGAAGSSVGGGGTGGVTPGGQLVDPSCTDGKYAETLPNAAADISQVAFNPSALDSYYLGVLGVRYPVGKDAVAGGLTNTSFSQSCIQLFAGSPQSAGQAIDSLGTVVHECGHLYDMKLSKGVTNVYFYRGDLSISCDRGDTVARGGDTFARSLIKTDEFSAKRPPCNGSMGGGCDHYADIYLDGDPNDTQFQGGDQGYNMLHEEAVQYVSSLAAGYAFADRLKSGQKVSDRDGIATFLWYLERYLRMARLQYPSAYQRISGDACWRDATLTTWGRAWLYLETTASNGSLGIEDSAILPLVEDPVLVEEIQRLRDASGCGK